jgi:hypothetical protein
MFSFFLLALFLSNVVRSARKSVALQTIMPIATRSSAALTVDPAAVATSPALAEAAIDQGSAPAQSGPVIGHTDESAGVPPPQTPPPAESSRRRTATSSPTVSPSVGAKGKRPRGARTPSLSLPIPSPHTLVATPDHPPQSDASSAAPSVIVGTSLVHARPFSPSLSTTASSATPQPIPLPRAPASSLPPVGLTVPASLRMHSPWSTSSLFSVASTAQPRASSTLGSAAIASSPLALPSGIPPTAAPPPSPVALQVAPGMAPASRVLPDPLAAAGVSPTVSLGVPSTQFSDPLFQEALRVAYEQLKLSSAALLTHPSSGEVNAHLLSAPSI